MSWQDDVMIEQKQADALWDIGEAEWRDMRDGEIQVETQTQLEV